MTQNKSHFLSGIPNAWKARILTAILGLLLLLLLGVGGGLLVHVILGMAPPTQAQADRTYDMVVVSVLVAPFVFFLGWMTQDLTKMIYQSIFDRLERRRYRIRH